MKHYTITTFQFDELPPEIQKEVWEQDTAAREYDHYSDEFRATLTAFENIFNISVYRWNVDSSHYYFDYKQTAATNADDINDPLRLATFVYNRYARYIRKGKYYSKGQWINGKYTNKSRHSRVIFSYDDCPLTGVCFDCDILRAVVDCLEYRRMFDTYDDLMTTALNEFFETWRDALAYAESFEFYAEEAAANEWEYTADGRRWET